MRSLKSAVATLTFSILAACTVPATQSAPVNSTGDRALLICETIEGVDGKSCDDLCAVRGSVCTGFKSIMNPFSCESPTSDGENCRCCHIGE